MDYQLDKECGVPLYRQLATRLQEAIDKGAYRDGDRLPTVDHLAMDSGLSKGTAKAAYNYLQDLGMIRKVRGSGIYVHRPARLTGTLETGALVDDLFSRLATMRSVTMAQAYLAGQQSLSALYTGDAKVCAALVDCNFETLHTTMQQLSSIKELTLLPYLIGDLLSGQVLISPKCAVALTPQTHFAELSRYTDPLHLRTEQFVLTESRETITALTILPDRQPVCVLYRSESFIKSIRYTLDILRKYNELVCGHEENLGETVESCALRGLPFIVPADYTEYSNAKTLQIIERARKCGSRIIPFRYEIDGGSFLHLEQKIQSLCGQERRVAR